MVKLWEIYINTGSIDERSIHTDYVIDMDEMETIS